MAWLWLNEFILCELQVAFPSHLAQFPSLKSKYHKPFVYAGIIIPCLSSLQEKCSPPHSLPVEKLSGATKHLHK